MAAQETQAEVAANQHRCGECRSKMVWVGKVSYCAKRGCSMYGRGVDDLPLPRKISGRIIPSTVVVPVPPVAMPTLPDAKGYPDCDPRYPWEPAAPLDAPGLDCTELDRGRVR